MTTCWAQNSNAGSGYRVAPSEASIAVLQNLSGLAYLRLPAGLHGDLAVLHTLGQLTHLTLTGPGISGSPDALAHLRLRFLALRGTRVSGFLSALRPSSDLELLHIEGGDVQGHLSDLQGLRALESLLLVAVDVTGRIEELWKSPSPRELQLVHVPVRGSFLGSLWNLMMFKSQYTALHVSLSRLTRMTNLTHLWLQGTYVDGSIQELKCLGLMYLWISFGTAKCFADGSCNVDAPVHALR